MAESIVAGTPASLNPVRSSGLTTEIAGLANQADALLFNFGNAALDLDAATSLLDALRETICKIGWMADLASEHLGGMVVVGDARDWLLAPISTDKPSRHETAIARKE